MSKVRVAPFSVSLDGFGAGPRQDLENPLGCAGRSCTGGFFRRKRLRRCMDKAGGIVASITTARLRRYRLRTLAHLFWGATCSGQSEGLGKTIRGEDGGVRIRHSMHQSLCSRILGVTL